MAILQFGVTLRDARANQFETVIGTSPKLRIMAGAKPATCADADAGTLLCEMTLPSNWMDPSASGVKPKLGTWSGTGHADAGAGINATYFRIKNNAGTITHCQGDVSAPGGGGAMTISAINIQTGQPVAVNTFTITEGNG